MASCGEGTDDVVEDSVDSDGTASPLRTNRDGLLMGMNRLASQSGAGPKKGAGDTENSRLLRTGEEHMFSSSTGPKKGAGDTENSRLLRTGEEHMFSSSDEDNSEQSQLLLPQSLQISPHLPQRKHPGENTPVFPSHLSHLKPQGEHSPVLSHLPNLKTLPENSPVFPPPAKIRKLSVSGVTVTKETSAENVDNDSDVTQLSDNNLEPQPELDLGNNSHDLAGEEQDGSEGVQGFHGDQSTKCSWEDQQTKCEEDKGTAAVQDSADRGAAASEGVLSQERKLHPEEELRKEELAKEDGTERCENRLEKGKEVARGQDVLEGIGQEGNETERNKSSLGKGKGVIRLPDECGEVSKGIGSEKGSSSLDSLQESVAAVSDVGADESLCEQHDEEMRLLGRLEARQEKLNPLLSTKDRATGLKVSRELCCIQSLIGTLIQAHQQQRRAISALSTEQMQEQMQLFVQRHKRLVQIFSVQKTATAKFKGRTTVSKDDANQSQPMSQTSSDISNEREELIGRKSVGCKKGRKSAASSSKSGSSEGSSVKSQGSSAKYTMTSVHGGAAQKLPLSNSSTTAEVPLTESSKESATAVQVLQALDGSSHLRAVMKVGSLQKGQIVHVVSQVGKEPVRYRVVGMENVGMTSASSDNRVAANSGQTIQHVGENVAESTATVVSAVGHDIATTVSAGSSALLSQQVATTDCSQTLLKTQAWKPPFKPSDGVSSVTQGVSEVTGTNVRTIQEKMVNSAKRTAGTDICKQSRTEVLWQKIVPQVQKQSATPAKTLPSTALKECLVGTKGLSTTGGVGHLQGLSTVGGSGQLQGLFTIVGAGGQPKGLSTMGATGQQLKGLSTTAGVGAQSRSITCLSERQLQGLSTTAMAGAQHTQGQSTAIMAGAQHTQGLSTPAVMEGQTAGTEVPTVSELLRAQLIQPGKDVLSCKGKGGLQFASLQPDGAVMTQGGLSFSTVGQWHRAIWGHRTGQKRAMVFRQVCYKGTPLADVSSKFTPAGKIIAPASAHLKHMQGGTPVGQATIPVQPIQVTGVTPAEQPVTPDQVNPTHSNLQEDVEVSLPCSGGKSLHNPVLQDVAQDNGTRPHNMAQDAAQDNSIPKPTSILLIANEELFLSRRLLPEKFWDSAEVKLNQFLEAAVRFE